MFELDHAAIVACFMAFAILIKVMNEIREVATSPKQCMHQTQPLVSPKCTPDPTQLTEVIQMDLCSLCPGK